jgi:hypothetical protein
MTFDAYEYIEIHSDSAIISIGSSKMREAFDGQLLGQLDDSDHDFYNLAIAGDRPYVRMLEVSAILELKPEMIILEIGPTTFSSLATPVPESVHSRMAHLISLGSVDLDRFPNSVLNSTDKEMLPNSRSEQLNLLASYVPIAIEDTIEIYTNMPDVVVYDMMWDNDWEDFHFNDYTHMSREGEVLFATKLIQQLSPLLEVE